ncbi:MAG TPA: hypothetical protein PKK10_12650 [Woeseiaceae bacterium]|nr:hypothetical protein [Woeseiaceae bacterium]
MAIMLLGAGCQATPPAANAMPDMLRGPLPMSAFAEPDGAKPVRGLSAGSLQIQTGMAASFVVHEDRFDYMGAGGDTIRQFPAANLSWVLSHGDVIPLDAGVLRTRHPAWEIAFQVGRAWYVDDDKNHVRYSVPFALVEKNANCTHNGVLTWVQGSDGKPSRVVYEIGSETCAYFKFDMWGALDAGFRDLPASEGKAALDAFRANQGARLPIMSFNKIVDKFPELDSSGFGAVANMHAEDISVYGFVVDGVHYRSDCMTRFGPYPFCNELLLPSYSTAKSLFAGLALMRLQSLIPGVAEEKIGALVRACDEEQWGDVSIENTLDMATGHYLSTEPDVDEGSAPHVEFLYALTNREKLAFACDFFPVKAAPGTVFVYHSSDTYLAGVAMRRALEEKRGRPVDIYKELLVDPFWAPLQLSAAIMSTRRSYDDDAQALTGWGLSYTSDDIARIAAWLVDGAAGGATPGIDRSLFDAALQNNPDDRGLQAGSPLFRYNNGFWAHDISGYIACDHPVWVPFMSGYGGISVVLFPNQTVYYYFSDGYTQRWREAAIESDKLRSMCE